jgi:hypothetical protein
VPFVLGVSGDTEAVRRHEVQVPTGILVSPVLPLVPPSIWPHFDGNFVVNMKVAIPALVLNILRDASEITQTRDVHRVQVV